MIQSMTGFGGASLRAGSLAFDIEVRSVNHRHLDTRLRMPRPLSACETELRNRIQQRIGRGKVDAVITSAEGSAPPARLEISLAVAQEYARVAAQLRDIDGVDGSLTADTLIGLPGVARLVEPELPATELLEALLVGLDEALDALLEMRTREGSAIERDLLVRLELLEALTASLSKRSVVVREAARERLHKRAHELELETGLIDEARLHQEIVIAADRLDLSEEIVRLDSHLVQFREIVASAKPGHPVGRRLDFLLQELGREVNTIGSKGSDASMAHEVVEFKTELERIREQVQNVE